MSYIKLYVGISFEPLSFSEQDRKNVEQAFKRWVPKHKLKIDSSDDHRGELVYEIILSGEKENVFNRLENLFLELNYFNIYFTSPPEKED